MRYTNATIANCDQKIKDLFYKNTEVIQDNKYRLKKGLLLHGETGRGKTYIMYAIHNWFGSKFNTSRITTWSEILFGMRLYYNDSKTNRNVIENLKEYDVIFIDDLGAEQKTEHNLDLLYILIDHCYIYEKSLILSTNLQLDDFVKTYGDRISTRIIEMCEVFEVVGSNRRLENK